MRSGRVAAMREEIAQLDMHFECGSIVGLGRGGEIGAQKVLGEFGGAVSVGENAGGIDESGTFAAIGRRRRIGERCDILSS